eukprot:4461434-Alexandrium_andersonii.AAC.1
MRPAKAPRRAASAEPLGQAAGGRPNVVHLVGFPNVMWRQDLEAFAVETLRKFGLEKGKDCDILCKNGDKSVGLVFRGG